MKNKLALALSVILSTSAFAAPNGDIELSWTYPTNALKDIIAFNIYSTNNFTSPVTNWPRIVSFDPNTDSPFKTIQGTNAVFKVDQTIVPGIRSFVLSGVVSNFWGVNESFFSSNSVPALPVIESNVSFGIRKK